MKYHVVVDLEMCGVSEAIRKKGYKHGHEIIEIGAVMMDDNYEIIDQFSTYVHPQYGALDPFISKLTGIKEHHIKAAPVLSVALDRFISWIGNRSVTIYSWSDSDYHQIKNEIKTKKISGIVIDALMKRNRWIDYQSKFAKRFDTGRAVALSEAVEAVGLEMEGRLHDGLDDAYNTARLIQKLQREPEFKLSVSLRIEIPELENIEDSSGK